MTGQKWTVPFVVPVSPLAGNGGCAERWRIIKGNAPVVAALNYTEASIVSLSRLPQITGRFKDAAAAAAAAAAAGSRFVLPPLHLPVVSPPPSHRHRLTAAAARRLLGTRAKWWRVLTSAGAPWRGDLLRPQSENAPKGGSDQMERLGLALRPQLASTRGRLGEIRVALGFASLFRLRNINIPAFHLFDHQYYTLITDYFGNVLTFIHFGLSSRRSRRFI